ncbi:hypothetical protein SeMB42_g06316 [Synchytrium endobioticum]|uniref:Uncharacterized protein n=1 Tax=Synchytrium endobioticum TaxID=286115 RepID=A0A507CM91_9FUNG|nr:hypothetical protein SeMB42_g06316 [Synchytrium endobioticum]
MEGYAGDHVHGKNSTILQENLHRKKERRARNGRRKRISHGNKSEPMHTEAGSESQAIYQKIPQVSNSKGSRKHSALLPEEHCSKAIVEENRSDYYGSNALYEANRFHPKTHKLCCKAKATRGDDRRQADYHYEPGKRSWDDSPELGRYGGSSSACCCEVEEEKKPDKREKARLEKAMHLKNEGDMLFRHGNYERAIEIYSSAIEANPANSTLYGNRAATFMMQRKWNSALHDCREATLIDPDFVKSYVRATKCYLHIGNINAAIQQIELAKSVVQKCATASNSLRLTLPELATTYRIRDLFTEYEQRKTDRDFKAALSKLEEAIVAACDVSRPASTRSDARPISTLAEADLSNVPLWWRLLRAEALVNCRDLEGARCDLSKIIAVDTRNSEALVIQARLLHITEFPYVSLIIETLRTALSYDPESKGAAGLLKEVRELYSLKYNGNDAFKNQKWDDALEAYTKWLERDTEQPLSRVKVLSNRSATHLKPEIQLRTRPPHPKS